MASYQIYRSTSLGLALQASLDEMIMNDSITDEMATKILAKYDKSMSEALEKRVKTRLTFNAKLDNFRFCDNVWTLLMKDVEFKDSNQTFTVDKLKVVACDGAKPIPPTPAPAKDPESSQRSHKKKNPKDKRRR